MKPNDPFAIADKYLDQSGPSSGNSGKAGNGGNDLAAKHQRLIDAVLAEFPGSRIVRDTRRRQLVLIEGKALKGN